MAGFDSPVPLGRAGTGGATIFGDGLGALRYLEKTDALRAAAEQRAAAARARQQEAEARDFATRLKLSDEGGVHYLPLLKTKATEAYNQMEQLINDRTLTRTQRAIKQQEIRDGYDREAMASKKNDEYLTQLGQRITTDKRYDRDKTIGRLTQTLYKDGAVTGPLEYDPQAAEQAVSTGNEHLNGVEVFKTFLRGNRPDAVTVAKEALPGGKGFRNTSSSDVYELTNDGKIKYDTGTNLPVVKATPQALNYFDSDPVNRQYLDGFEQQHQAQMASAVQKMQNYEELTPEEAEAVRVEQSPAGRRMELFKRGLMEQGYGRQSTAILQKAAPRPRAAGSKTPKFTQQGVTSFASGVLGGTGAYSGTPGIAHYGASDPLKRVTASGKVEDYTANVTHRNYLMSTAGGKLTHITNNSAPQELSYQSPVLLLRSATGNAVFPTDPQIVAATERGDMKPLEEWTRKERARDPNLKPAYYMQAVPKARADLNVGSSQEVFQQLKAKENAYRDAYKQGGEATAELAKNDPEAAKEARLAALFSGSSKPPRFYSDAELQEQARKLYSNRNATLYVPYSGEEKLKIDANTDYLLRDPKRKKAMDDYLNGVEARTRPGAAEQRQATAGRGPLAGLTAPAAAPAKAAPASKAPAAAAPANKYGFKFKTR